MAFNPFVTFQRNRRFWMAGILLICMISFVFFGFKGGCDERTGRIFGGSGPTVASIDGRNITRRDLDELRTQRKLANTYMKACADQAYKNVSKEWYDQSKATDDKDVEGRPRRLAMLMKMRETLGIRKARPLYFEGGLKFDDLLEFKLWQAEADRLGIKIERGDVQFLFNREFFIFPGKQFPLADVELTRLQHEARQEHREASDEYFFRAVAEEFRVKIAQYALLYSQPYSLLYNAKRRPLEYEPKYLDADVPDETRAPLTLAQVWDHFKATRSEFGVTLIPVPVQGFASKIKEPDDLQKQAFFNDNKNESFDPASDKYGMQMPPQFKIEFLMADAKSPAYLSEAKFGLQLKATNPIALDALQSPLAAATRYMAVAQKQKMDLQGLSEAQSKRGRYEHLAALNTEVDYATPILTYMASRHPQAIASLIGACALPSMGPLGEGFNAEAGFLAWGTKKFPLEGSEITDEKTKTKTLTKVQPNYDQERFGSKFKNDVNHKDYQEYQPGELEIAFNSEERRRLPVYRDHFAFAMSMSAAYATSMSPAILPLEAVPAFMTMDESRVLTIAQVFQESVYRRPPLTIETVQRDFDDMIVRRTAEQAAQRNILAAKQALDKAGGQDIAEDFRGQLKTLVPKYKLTYLPSPDKRGTFHDKHSIETAEEFAPLRESYLKYYHMINLFEGRDLKPETVLKPGDFSKLFQGTESFTAAAKYRVMPWPPEVKADNSRELKVINPRLLSGVPEEEKARFKSHIEDTKPGEAVPSLHLYKDAEQPILFWRTADRPALSLDNYKQIETLAKKYQSEREALEAKRQQQPKNSQLPPQIAELKKKEADLQRVRELIVEGFKVERARKEEALPKARDIAKKLVDVPIDRRSSQMKVQAAELAAEIAKLAGAEKLKTDVIEMNGLSSLHRDHLGDGAFDYSAPTLPKDTIVYPRDDAMQQILSLSDLKGPIKTGYAELDDLNKELFEEGQKIRERMEKNEKKKFPDAFVQVIANKPRKILYVAAITTRRGERDEDLPFKISMVYAPFPDNTKMPGMRDRFLDRTLEAEAATYRSEFVKSLQAAHDLTIVDREARAVFDGKDEK